jgi:microcystin-dependent protein
MSKWRDFAPGSSFPSTWTDGMEELLSDFVGGNFRLTLASTTVAQVVASAGDGLVGIAIDGKPRWATSTKTAAHPGGAAGNYDVFVTGYPDSFATDANGHEANNTVSMEFGLKIGAPSGAGAEVISRKVGFVVWNGTRITAIVPLVNDPGPYMDGQDSLPIGSQVAYAGTGDPAGMQTGIWVLADGRLIDKTTYAEFFDRVGHAYNLGVDPGANKVKIPDKRGRVSVGADNMGTAQGAAGRIPTTGTPSFSAARGQNGGVARHTLALTEAPVHTHSDGTLTTDTHAGHTHADGTLVAASAGDHAHSADGTLTAASAGDHAHSADGNLTAASPGVINRNSGNNNSSLDHNHPEAGIINGNEIQAAAAGGYTEGGKTTGTNNQSLTHTHTTDIGSHTHDVTGNTSTTGAHTHDVTGNTSTTGAHTHDVTGATASSGNHSHDVSGATGSAGSDAAHTNMPPYEVDNVIVRIA